MPFTPEQRAELAKPLNPAHVKPPAPGKHGDYIEGWRVIDEANRIFGFDGWTRETVACFETARVENNGKWSVGYMVKVRVTACGVTREGTGCGSGDGMRSLIDAIESAAKEAETDAMKRALMTFGNPFGLALYDKTKANVQAPPPPTISDDERDLIATLAQAAGKTLQFICESYGISNLKELPAAKYAGLKRRLEMDAAEQPKQQQAA
jgi:DNA recombination protein Rad52